jgi:hypothetical protein
MAHTVREAVAVFDTEQQLEAAVDEIESHGFDRAEISLLAGEDTVEAKLGHRYRRITEAEDDPNAPRLSFVSRQAIHEAESAAIGFPLYIGATLGTGIAAAAGGPIGAVLAAAALGGGIGGTLGGFDGSGWAARGRHRAIPSAARPGCRPVRADRAAGRRAGCRA